LFLKKALKRASIDFMTSALRVDIVNIVGAEDGIFSDVTLEHFCMDFFSRVLLYS
jgi:hypothetical protein